MSETRQHDRSESPIITAEEAKKTLRSTAVLEKPDYFGKQGEEDAIAECNLPEDLSAKLAKMSKDGKHIIRLLRRTESERTFAIAYLQYRDQISADDPELFMSAKNVIASEGLDTMMFWTFAPYIFKSLIKKGVAPAGAIKQILFWSKDGISTASEARSKEHRGNIDSMHLRGLEKYRTTIPKGWFLDKDPKHVSHKFTEQEADSIAELLIGKRVIFRQRGENEK